MTRPIELIHVEIEDCSREMADCVRQQAELMLRRADGLERSYKYIATEATEEQRIYEETESEAIMDDTRVAREREAELGHKFHRLVMEFRIARKHEKGRG